MALVYLDCVGALQGNTLERGFLCDVRWVFCMVYCDWWVLVHWDHWSYVWGYVCERNVVGEHTCGVESVILMLRVAMVCNTPGAGGARGCSRVVGAS